MSAPAAVIRIGLLGFGNVGQAVAELASSAADQLTAAGLRPALAAALVRDIEKPRRCRLVDLVDGPDDFFARPLDVVVEAMGGVCPAFEYVRRALEAGIPVVTANKTLMARKGNELRAIARQYGVSLAYEAAVIAGVPFLGAAVKRPLAGAPRRIAGILNGTSHFLTSALAGGASFDDALRIAVERGYAEPDSSADISGRDASEKLTILAHLAGCPDLGPDDLTSLGLDALQPVDFAAARALGGVIKPIAMASFTSAAAGAWVGPALIDAKHPWASTQGIFNCVEYDNGGIPVTFSGPGAGPAVTAATVLDDVAEVIAGTWSDRARPGSVRTTDACALRQPSAGSWYLRIQGGGFTPDDVAEHLATHGVAARRIEQVAGGLAVRTIAASWAAINVAAEVLNAAGAQTLVLPVMEKDLGSRFAAFGNSSCQKTTPAVSQKCENDSRGPFTVVKLGGSVLADLAAYESTAAFLARLARDGNGQKVLAVVSAEDGHTDELAREAEALAATPARDALDLLWSTGELRSVALLTLALKHAGVSATALNAHETGLRAEASANLVNPINLGAALARHDVVVVPGFLATHRQQVVTLGRGGSDLSAVLLAAALSAGDCVLVKDVDGYFTHDPAVDDRARPIAALTYDAAIAMADEGCPLVQRQALVAARDSGVHVTVRSAAGTGTRIH